MTKEEAINEIKSWDFLEGKEIEAIHTLIPELTESEDERIRKWLSDLLDASNWRNDWPYTKQQVINYLEKQKEQKSAEIDEDIELGLDRALQIIKEAKGVLKGYQSDDGIYECDHAIRTLTHILKNGIEQKPEEKPINWTELTWEDINELEDIINKVHYEFRNGIGQESFGKEVLEQFREYKGDEYLDEIKQKPILEVFGFKVGDAVRLKDGDGRKHIIKSFEENEGVHGPNFYRVVFEDNAADYIFTGDKYPNGYYTQMEKFEEEQKPAEWSKEDDALLKEIVSFFKDGTVKLQHDLDLYAGFLENKFKSLRPQPKKELSIEKAIQWLDDTFYFLDNSSGRGRDCEITTHDFDSLEEMYDSFRKAVIVDSEPSWKPSEEQMEALNEIINTLAVSKHPHENDYLFNILNGLRKNLKTIPRDWVPVKEEHWKPSEEQMEAFSQIVQQFKPDKELESLYEDLQKRYGTS